MQTREGERCFIDFDPATEDLIDVFRGCFGTTPRGPAIRVLVNTESGGECYVNVVFHDFRPDVESRPESAAAFVNITSYYTDEISAERLLFNSSGQGIQGLDASVLLDRIFEDVFADISVGSVWKPQKRLEYKDEQIMMDNVEQAEDYARFTRCQRWWSKLVNRFTTYHMLIPYLYGVLPHVWSSHLYSYSSLPDEPASLLAEHIAICPPLPIEC